MSIRARLTAWYSIVVVVVLISATLVVDVVQERLMLQGLDDELGRQMATLQGVMRTEFGEGLDLQGAADEASIEVLAPGRTLVLTRPDGALLARWGASIDPKWRPSTGAVLDTADIERPACGSDPNRSDSGLIATSRPSSPPSRSSKLRLRSCGARSAWAFSSLWSSPPPAGWLVGRQTLRPLDEMASQAMAIKATTAGDRLRAPHPHDELGRFASAFNGLLDRLVHALQAQRQFMADASHELRTPVSVVRTTAQVALARDMRSPEDYREMMTIVGEQAERLSHLVDTMFLLSRAEANGLPLRPEAVYVDDLVSESARALQVLARDREVTVTADGENEVRFVGDDRLLRQMVTNLLDNKAYFFNARFHRTPAVNVRGMPGYPSTLS